MAATNINRVVMTGNLTRDPELRNTPSGTSSVCSLRIACNTRRKDQSTGEWTDKPNYFDVTVWGMQGENCAQYLSKGRPSPSTAGSRWREWQDQQGNKRQSVDIIADSVQFLGSREGGENGGRFTPQSDVPADTSDFAQAPAGSGDRTTTFRSDPEVASTQEQPGRQSSVEEQAPRPRQASRPVRASPEAGGSLAPFCKEKVDRVDYRTGRPSSGDQRQGQDPPFPRHRCPPPPPVPARPGGQTRVSSASSRTSPTR